jgi:hypothetical protein
MKRLILLSSLLAVFILPDFAQDNVESVKMQVPMKQLIIPENKVPAPVASAIKKDFITGQVMQWYTFPYLFKKYGWNVLNTNEMKGKQKPDRYAVYVKANDGSRIDAVYTSKGKLIREREVLKNIALPLQVAHAIASSKYKGWVIDKDKVIITDGIKNTKEYIVTVEKGQNSKTLYYDDNGSVLPVS